MRRRRALMRTISQNDISPAAWIGMGAIGLSILAAPFNLTLAVLPLALFLLLCFTAPFFPGFGFFLPVVSRGNPEKCGVALTFDDGPDPLSTPALLDLLSRYRATATFYVTGQRAAQYPDLIHEIIHKGHTIGNHSFSHDNLIMVRSSGALRAEIEKAQQALQALGVFPLTFRPPVGVTNPKLGAVLRQMGLFAVNFNRRAGDRGNRKITRLSEKILENLRPGDIIMLHDIPPRKGETTERWLGEVDRILAGIQARGLKILPLPALIDRAVMSVPAALPENRTTGV